MHQLEITYRAVEDLKPRARNPRTHSKKQTGQLARSIERFGFTSPVLLDENNQIVAGHGRVAAAKLLGMKQVPTIRLPEMSEAELVAYVIADNELAARAGWDKKLLALELQYIASLDLDFDLTLTGFEAPEIDFMISDLATPTETPGADAADQCVPPLEQDAVTRPGDIWSIGPHRLICGDATRAETYDYLLGGQRAQMIFADPPYNVPIQGHVSGKRANPHREFAMASGEMTPAEFTAFLQIVFACLVRHSIDGAIHFQCMDWRHMQEMLSAGLESYTELKNLCVWNKSAGGMGSFYRSQHELVFVFKAGKDPHINNIRLGSFGRNRTNVWDFPGVNGPGSSRGDLELHPTVKPIALVAEAIRDCSNRGGIILDPFAGSGTTLIAAARTGRIAYGIEIDPLYCDLILRRMTQTLGLDVRLEATGKTFAETMRGRVMSSSNGAVEAA